MSVTGHAFALNEVNFSRIKGGNDKKGESPINQ